MILSASDEGISLSRRNITPIAKAFMITLTVILLLVFVPAARRNLARMLWGIFAAPGIIFLADRDSRAHRRGR